MNSTSHKCTRVALRTLRASGLLCILLATPAFAQGSPWEQAANALRDAFIGPIARGLSLVAIVLGGLSLAFGEGQGKRAMGGVIFGVATAVGAAQMLVWLFG